MIFNNHKLNNINNHTHLIHICKSINIFYLIIECLIYQIWWLGDGTPSKTKILAASQNCGQTITQSKLNANTNFIVDVLIIYHSIFLKSKVKSNI